MTSKPDGREVRETVTSVLGDHPVAAGFLFGSQVRGDADAASDVDVAVAFEEREPGAPDHVDMRLRLGADLAIALGTDDVDVVDLRTASPALVRAVFREGERLVGSERMARRLRDALLDDAEEERRSPAERFDDALAAIDDHLA